MALLQDCSGPVFERLLADLSTRVLFKRLAADEDDGSTIQQYLCHNGFGAQQQVVPASLAYRYALAAQSKERGSFERRWHKFGRVLATKGAALQVDEQLASVAASPRKDKKIPRRTLDRLHKHAEMVWTGDRQWVDVLLLGDNAGKPQQDMLDRPFKDVWSYATKDTLYTIRGENTASMLQDLESRVQSQSARLEKWRFIRDGLSRKSTVSKKEPEVRPAKKAISSHQSQLPTTCGHKASGDAPNHEREPLDGSQAPISLGRAMSQRGMNEDNLESSKPTSQGHLGATAAMAPAKENRRRQYHLRSRTADNLRQLDSNQSWAMSNPVLQRGSGSAVLANQHEQVKHVTKTGLATEPEKRLPSLGNDLLESKQLPSLAERTRMSMALMSPLKKESTTSTASHVSQRNTDRPYSAGGQEKGTPFQPTAPFESLADRARQSLNLTATKTPTPKRPRKPRTSSLNDTNHIGGPKQAPPAAGLDDPRLLEETLQSLEEDYESIFKPRPKVAVSPVLRPLASGRSIGEALDLNGHISGDDDDFS